MSNTSIGSFTPSPLDAVVTLLLPRMRAFVGPAVEKTARTSLSAADLAQLKELVLVASESEDVTADSISWPEPGSVVPDDEIAAMVEDESREAAWSLALSWLQALALSAGPEGQLSAASLDDKLLPPMERSVLEAFAASIEQHDGLNGHEYEILRQVKADLPEGTVLPAEVMVWLESSGVTLVP